MRGCAFVICKFKLLLIEVIVCGYLVGFGWKEYQKTGAVCGIKLPAGLREAEKLPQPLFTPSTKAAVGEHDENISFERAMELLGEVCVREVRDVALVLYIEAADYALTKGIIIADIKFEFGVDEMGKLYLIDEVFTLDFFWFWPVD